MVSVSGYDPSGRAAGHLQMFCSPWKLASSCSTERSARPVLGSQTQSASLCCSSSAWRAKPVFSRLFLVSRCQLPGAWFLVPAPLMVPCTWAASKQGAGSSCSAVLSSAGGAAAGALRRAAGAVLGARATTWPRPPALSRRRRRRRHRSTWLRRRPVARRACAPRCGGAAVSAGAAPPRRSRERPGFVPTCCAVLLMAALERGRWAVGVSTIVARLGRSPRCPDGARASEGILGALRVGGRGKGHLWICRLLSLVVAVLAG